MKPTRDWSVLRSTIAFGLVAGAVVAVVLAVGAWSGQPASSVTATGSIQSETVADENLLNVVGRLSRVEVGGTAGSSSTKAASTNPPYAYDNAAALRVEACDTAIAGPFWPRSLGSHVLVAPTSVVEVPSPTNAKLQNYVDQLFKHANKPGRIGDGTTMAALPSELATGAGPHIQKATEIRNGLGKWLTTAQGQGASATDRSIAQDLFDQLDELLP